MDETDWSVAWAHGAFRLHAVGGMLSGLRLRRNDGELVAPLYEPHWQAEGAAPIEDAFLRKMHGEFLCLPFGSRYRAEQARTDAWRRTIEIAEAAGGDVGTDDDLPHGACANLVWTLLSRTETELVAEVVYPEASPIERVTRRIAADPSAPRVVFDVTVTARRDCRRPIGVHPNFALPAEPGALRIHAGAFRFGLVHPALTEAGTTTRAKPGAEFHDLSEVPMADGTSADLGRLPLEGPAEEILLLAGASGDLVIENDELGAAFRLRWDRAVLPSLLLWISNGGRTAEPWSGRNRCLGVEPVASSFDLGCRVAGGINPLNERGVRTSVAFEPGRPVSFSYEISCIAPGKA